MSAANAGAVLFPVFMGGGAGVGALLDELTHKYDSVYVSKSMTGQRLRLAPVVSQDTKGVRLTLKF